MKKALFSDFLLTKDSVVVEKKVSFLSSKQSTLSYIPTATKSNTDGCTVGSTF